MEKNTGDNISMEHFTFESREDYDIAKKELGVIYQLQENADLTDGKNALKIYNKAVSEKIFKTVIGYFFLEELRKVIVQSGVTSMDLLENIPVMAVGTVKTDVMMERNARENRFKRLLEEERLKNKKMVIVIAALVILLFGFVLINFRFEYSIFTYFTNYKAKMEEELIDKYENWQSDLEERERKLGNGGNYGG